MSEQKDYWKEYLELENDYNPDHAQRRIRVLEDCYYHSGEDELRCFAAYKLGATYYWGLAVPVDHAEGEKYLKYAADLNEGDSVKYLGMILLKNGDIKGADYLFKSICLSYGTAADSAEGLYLARQWYLKKGHSEEAAYIDQLISRLWDPGIQIPEEKAGGREIAKAIAIQYHLADQMEETREDAHAYLTEASSLDNGYATYWLNNFPEYTPDMATLEKMLQNDDAPDLFIKFSSPKEALMSLPLPPWVKGADTGSTGSARTSADNSAARSRTSADSSGGFFKKWGSTLIIAAIAGLIIQSVSSVPFILSFIVITAVLAFIRKWRKDS